jgi:hypothetical protein
MLSDEIDHLNGRGDEVVSRSLRDRRQSVTSMLFRYHRSLRGSSRIAGVCSVVRSELRDVRASDGGAAERPNQTAPALDLAPHGFYDSALTGGVGVGYNENLRL